MEKTNQHTSGIIGILNRARIYNPEIGNYQEHYINERFGYTIKLSNGRIEMPIEVAGDYEVQPASVSEDKIKRVSNKFIKQ